jgi:hypothetical protein
MAFAHVADALDAVLVVAEDQDALIGLRDICDPHTLAHAIIPAIVDASQVITIKAHNVTIR